jgi:hypothetical protein
LDIIMGQGEGKEGIEERIFIGKDIDPDTASPIISHYQIIENKKNGILTIKARVHDNKSPNMPQDWSSVNLEINGASGPVNMTWYGENLWVASISKTLVKGRINICATDYAGNKECLSIK